MLHSRVSPVSSLLLRPASEPHSQIKLFTKRIDILIASGLLLKEIRPLGVWRVELAPRGYLRWWQGWGLLWWWRTRSGDLADGPEPGRIEVVVRRLGEVPLLVVLVVLFFFAVHR